MGITQRYQIFFFLTAMLPILLFSALFFENSYARFNQNTVNLLETGVLYVEDSIRDNHHELILSARQAAHLSANDKYHEFLKTGNAEPFLQYMTRYRQTNKFDIVIVANGQGKTVIDASNGTVVNRQDFEAKIQEALRGDVVSDFQRFRLLSSDAIHLAYVACAPIPKRYGSKEFDGVLYVGRYVKDDPALAMLTKLMPLNRLRLLVKVGPGYDLELSQFEAHKAVVTPHLIEQSRLFKKVSRSETLISDVFDEQISGKKYYSRIIGLQNRLGQDIGLLALSVPHESMEGFVQENMVLIILFIGMVLLIVGLAGRRFKHDFIEPLSQLSEGCKQVIAGNMNSRIVPKNGSHSDAIDSIHSFNSLVQKLDENEQLRNTFIATLSHDLRTPLLAQKQITSLLMDSSDTVSAPQFQKFISGLHQSNDAALQMVNQLLDTYRYEEGQIQLACERFSLFELVYQCLLEIQPLADEQEIALINQVPEELPLIWADKLQLRRVIHNLVMNAVQNIPEGSTVTVEAYYQNRMFHLDIKDNGQGIPENVLCKVFDRYYTGNRIRKRIGTGLGLYICKMIVELHNGMITVASSLGQGTVFSIQLPDRSQ